MGVVPDHDRRQSRDHGLGDPELGEVTRAKIDAAELGEDAGRFGAFEPEPGVAFRAWQGVTPGRIFSLSRGLESVDDVLFSQDQRLSGREAANQPAAVEPRREIVFGGHGDALAGEPVEGVPALEPNAGGERPVVEDGTRMVSLFRRVEAALDETPAWRGGGMKVDMSLTLLVLGYMK